MDELTIDIDATAKSTHISKINLSYLINQEFDKLNEFKTNSFISIIQREMGYDLSELKDSADLYYKNKIEEQSILIKEYKENRPKQNKLKYILIFLVLAILSYVLYGMFISTNKSSIIQSMKNTNTSNNQDIKPTVRVEDTIIEKKDILVDEPKTEIIDSTVTENKETINEDTTIPKNDIDDKNLDITTKDEVIKENKVVEEEIKKEDPKVELSIKVKAKKKVWIGVTYLDTLKTKDYTVKEFTFDPNRDFVAVFGHNFVKIITQDKTIDFTNDRDKRRISYKDGKVKIITKKKLIKIVKKYQSNR